ncbi:MAG: hypothetical protein MJZ64_03635 [Paludibacteraceae bacterium]|nr:hypothetical protein [Paludibacteraceae bacterium]
MAKVTYFDPIEELDGRLTTRRKFDETGRMLVSRTKKHRLPNGKVIVGKNETYCLHKHEGAYSERLTAHRTAYKEVLTKAHEELANATKKAMWEQRWKEHLEHVRKGEKLYSQLFGFVVAMMWKEGKLLRGHDLQD